MKAQLSLASAALLAMICAGPAFAYYRGPVLEDHVTLPSGESVTLLSAKQLKSPAGWSALALEYQTAIPFDNKVALRQEADEIWNRTFLASLENENYQHGLLIALEPHESEDPAPQQSSSFAFQKYDGFWRAVDFTPEQKPVLTEDSIRAMLTRYDSAVALDEMNAALLYLGAKWTGSGILSTSSATPMQPVDRLQFVTGTAKTFVATKKFSLARKINAVTISPDGTSAEVVSDEVISGMVSGAHVQNDLRTTDSIGIEGAGIVLAKSVSETVR